MLHSQHFYICKREEEEEDELELAKSPCWTNRPSLRMDRAVLKPISGSNPKSPSSHFS